MHGQTNIKFYTIRQKKMKQIPNDNLSSDNSLQKYNKNLTDNKVIYIF